MAPWAESGANLDGAGRIERRRGTRGPCFRIFANKAFAKGVKMPPKMFCKKATIKTPAGDTP